MVEQDVVENGPDTTSSEAESTFTCETCGKVFASARSLNGHKLSHLERTAGTTKKTKKAVAGDVVRVEPVEVTLNEEEQQQISGYRRRRMLTDEEFRARQAEDEYSSRYGARYLNAQSEIDLGRRLGESEAETASQKQRISDLEEEIAARDKADEEAEDSESEEVSSLTRALEKKDQIIMEVMKQSHEKEMLLMQQSHEKEMLLTRQATTEREAYRERLDEERRRTDKAEWMVELEKVRAENRTQTTEQAVVQQASKGIERLADAAERVGMLVATGTPRPLSESPGMKPPPPRSPGEKDVADVLAETSPEFVDRPIPDFREIENKRRKEMEVHD